MKIDLKDPEQQYEATVELEPDGLVWLTIEKLYKSDNPSFRAFLSEEFAAKLGEALLRVAKGESYWSEYLRKNLHKL